jgi:hypothetical protein
MLDLASAFAPHYAGAREKFHAAAATRSLAVERHPHPSARGVTGEELAIDVAIAGSVDAAAVLFVSSAMHGVEGFCGSGCQVGLLRDEFVQAALARCGVALVLVHAVNPYGFSHLRRANEDNVDLNRNFRDFRAPPPSNDGYARLHAVLVPPTWPPTAEDSEALGGYVARYGVTAMQSMISRGQSEFPDGLFYAGRAPAWSNTVLRGIFTRHGGNRERLGWIDIHTGLGAWAHGEKIYFGPRDAAMIARARAWYGGDVATVYDGTSSSAELTGDAHDAVLDACPQAEYTGIVLEFGTRSLNDVMQALRADQWLANHCDAAEPVRATIRRQMREAFHDDSPTWQAMAYAQARVAVLQALRGLSAQK